jgi:hypothetical protein
VFHVHLAASHKLAKLACALRIDGGIPGLGDRRKQHGNQNGDNAYDNQKFHQRETSGELGAIFVRPPHQNLDQVVDIFALFMDLQGRIVTASAKLSKQIHIWLFASRAN